MDCDFAGAVCVAPDLVPASQRRVPKYPGAHATGAIARGDSGTATAVGERNGFCPFRRTQVRPLEAQMPVAVTGFGLVPGAPGDSV